MQKRISKVLRDTVLTMQGLKYNFFRRRRNSKKPPIKLYWWHEHQKGIANFGDEITKDLLLALFGYNSIYTPQNEAELAGAGSILEIVSHRGNDNEMYIWGSGFMWRCEQEAGDLNGLKFCAVRGVKTYERVNSVSRKIALGDPGLLASIVYRRAGYKTDKIGVVVHFIDANEPLVKKLKSDNRFVVIDALDSPQDVALSITSCKFIMSSSLHGLIFADSFNIPNIHLRFSGNVAGGGYKFEDYYSATGRTYRAADKSRVFDDEYLEELILSFRPVSNLRRLQKKLVRSFPK